MKEHLKRARDRLGLTLEAAAMRMGTSATQLYRLEEGERKLTWEWAERAGSAYDVDATFIMFGRAAPGVPVQGLVDDRAEIRWTHDGHEMVDCPRGLNHRNIAALKVTGEALAPAIGDGWFVFFNRHYEGSAADVLHQLCVVELYDGPTVLRSVRRGPTAGHYNLEAPHQRTIEDVEIRTFRKVRAILPADLVNPSNVRNVGDGSDVSDTISAGAA